MCYICLQGLKLIKKTRRSSSPLSPTALSVTGRKSVKTYDKGLNDDDDDDEDDGEEILHFERKIR